MGLRRKHTCRVLGKPSSHPRGPGLSPGLAQSGGLLTPRIRRARAPHGILDNSGVWVVLTWSPGGPHSAPAARLSSGWREGPANWSDEGVWLSGSRAQAAHREPSTDPQTLLALCSVGQAPQTRAGKADPGAGDLASSPAAPLLNPLSQLWDRYPSSSSRNTWQMCAWRGTPGLVITCARDLPAGLVIIVLLSNAKNAFCQEKSTEYHE